MQRKMNETKWAVLELVLQEVGCIWEEQDKSEDINAKVPPPPLPVAKGQPTLKLWPASVDTHSFLNGLKSRDKHVVGILNI